MIEVLGAWCIKLVGAGLISSVILAVCPEGKSKSSVKFACSLMCLIVFVSAIKNLPIGKIRPFSSASSTTTKNGFSCI